MFAKTRLFVTTLILNWSLIFGFLSATVIFSKYIFGPHNLYEEIVEALNKFITGDDIDLSPEVSQETTKDLNRLIPDNFNLRDSIK